MKVQFHPETPENPGFELLPCGDYRFAVTSCEERVTQGDDPNPCWHVKAKPIEPDGYSREVLVVIVFFVHDPKKMGFTMQKLRALGYNVAPGGTFEEDPRNCVGRTFMGSVTHRKYKSKDGKDRESEDVRMFQDCGAGNLKPENLPKVKSSGTDDHYGAAGATELPF